MMQQNFIPAVNLRNKDILVQIPADRPGYYKWWAPKTVLDSIFEKLGLTTSQVDEFQKYIETRDNYYCIYVGIAANDSIRDRLDTHVNQYKAERNIRRSTLRKSLTSLFAQNKQDIVTTNKIIDLLRIEYFAVDLPIKSQEAINKIEGVENDLLSCEYLYVLNIQKNRHPLAQITIPRLKTLRKMD